MNEVLSASREMQKSKYRWLLQPYTKFERTTLTLCRGKCISPPYRFWLTVGLARPQNTHNFYLPRRRVANLSYYLFNPGTCSHADNGKHPSADIQSLPAMLPARAALSMAVPSLNPKDTPALLPNYPATTQPDSRHRLCIRVELPSLYRITKGS